MSFVISPFTQPRFTQATVWTGLVIEFWIKAAWGGDMSFDKFIVSSYPLDIRKAHWIQAFFEPQLSRYGYQS